MTFRKGQRIELRLIGSEHWGHGTLLLASPNGRSLAVAGEAVPVNPGRGMFLNPAHGKTVMLTLQEDGRWQDFLGNFYEVRADHPDAITTAE